MLSVLSPLFYPLSHSVLLSVHFTLLEVPKGKETTRHKWDKRDRSVT